VTDRAPGDDADRPTARWKRARERESGMRVRCAGRHNRVAPGLYFLFNEVALLDRAAAAADA
jgi:hypothetical protein